MKRWKLGSNIIRRYLKRTKLSKTGQLPKKKQVIDVREVTKKTSLLRCSAINISRTSVGTCHIDNI